MQNDPAELSDLNARARQMVNTGDFDGARGICDQVFQIDPGNLGALQTYMSATEIAEGDVVFERLKVFSGYDGFPPSIRSQLQFMLGKGLGDLGLYQRAFKAFVSANALKQTKFDAAQNAAFARRLITAVRAAPELSLPPSGPRMVFILGMPRSGTSLMAQSLAAHPAIKNLGEMTALGTALTTSHGKPASLMKFLADLDLTKLTYARDKYLAEIPDDLRHSGCILIDKMPENYWLAWAVPMLFPNAAVVHMRRDRIATCWSCFRNDFGNGHAYSNDFNNLLQHFDACHMMTEAWKTRRPSSWAEVWLDDLVHNTRKVIEPVLKGLNLEWDKACLAPERQGGTVKTLSKRQVRQGIQAGIAQDWENYRPFIKDTWDVK